MTPPSDIVAALVLGAIAVIAGAVAARVFVGALLPGGKRAAALVGGMLAGLLAGQIGAALAPDSHEAWLRGGVEERRRLDAFDDETRSQVLALREYGVTPTAIEEQAAARNGARAEIHEAFEDARAQRRGALSWVNGGLLGLALALLVPYWWPVGRGGGAERWLVVLAAVLGLSVAWALMPAALGLGWVGAMIGAMLAAIAPAPSARATRRRAPWCLGGLVVVLVLMGIVAGEPGVANAAPVGVLVLAGIVGWWLAGAAMRRARVRTARRLCRRIAVEGLLAGAVALAMLRLDAAPLWGDWVFWVAFTAALFASSDLRWLVLAAALRGLRRPEAYIDAERCANAGGGVVQFTLALLLFQSGVIDAGLLVALVTGGAVGEMTVVMRRRIARAMQRGEPIGSVFEREDPFR